MGKEGKRINLRFSYLLALVSLMFSFMVLDSNEAFAATKKEPVPTPGIESFYYTYTYKSSGTTDIYTNKELTNKVPGGLSASKPVKLIDFNDTYVTFIYANDTSSNPKKYYAKSHDFSGGNFCLRFSCPYIYAASYATTYRYKNSSTKLGWIDKGDKVYLLRGNSTTDWLQVIYPKTDEKSYYMGWVKNTDIFGYDISKCTVSLSNTSFWYNTKAITPTVTVKNGNLTLTNGVEYTVAYSNNTNAGTATVTVTGSSNYKGTVKKIFTIKKINQNFSVYTNEIEVEEGGVFSRISANGIGAISYISSNPDVALVDANGVVTGISRGSAKITVKAAGNGNYNAASKDIVVNVYKNSDQQDVKEISTCNIVLDLKLYIYDGNKKEPGVSVKNNDDTLQKGVDYSVSYLNNINAGTAKVVINGMGNYTGSRTITYTIKKASVNNATVTLKNNTLYYYNNVNKNKCIINSVKVGGRTLKGNTDYTTDYSVTWKGKNVPGTAKVIIKGKGNYEGSFTKTYTIKVENISNLRLQGRTNQGELDVIWENLDDQCTGYKIKYSTSRTDLINNKCNVISKNTSKYDHFDNKSIKCTITGLSSGTYYVQMIVYKNAEDGKTYWSSWSDIKSMAVNNSTTPYVDKSNYLWINGIKLDYKVGSKDFPLREPSKSYVMKIDGKNVNVHGYDCYGFAEYVQYKLFGCTDYNNTKNFKKIVTNKSNYSESDLKKWITEIGVGGHIRTKGKEHSFVVIDVTDAGFKIVDDNGTAGDDKIGIKYFTWKDYKNSDWGKRGIKYMTKYIGN